MAVRIAIEYHIAAQPRTPFPASRDFAPVGSMSLDSRVAWLPYESSSFATSRGNEGYGEKNSESYTSGTISAFPLTQTANPVTLTLKIAAQPPPQPSARRAVKLKNPPAVRPVHLKNPHTEGVSTGASHVPCAILSGLLYN